MADKEDFFHVRKIENGVVVDHLPAGSALKILSLLGVDASFKNTVTVALNVPSTHYSVKDLIKIEGKEIDAKQMNRIALVAPEATINQIKNYEVVDKHIVQVPPVLENVINCPNGNCVTNADGWPKLLLEQKSPLLLRCAYCEKVYAESELKYE